MAAAPAVSIDVVNMPEAGRAGVECAFLVRALDPYGNVDENFEREVTLDSDGAPPRNGVGVHASFELAGSAAAPPRESIEARVVCFWFARDGAAPPEL